MEDLENIATKENRKAKNLTRAIAVGSLAPIHAGCCMINIDSVENIGYGLITAGVVVFAGAAKKYLRLTKNSE